MVILPDGHLFWPTMLTAAFNVRSLRMSAQGLRGSCFSSQFFFFIQLTECLVKIIHQKTLEPLPITNPICLLGIYHLPQVVFVKVKSNFSQCF